jgi:hypothetical protein
MQNAIEALISLLKSDPNAANAFGALASAAAAFLALAVSVISLIVSLWALAIQRRHNKLSVRPLPEVTVADYEDCLRVTLRNNGTGPLFVTDMKVTDGIHTSDSLIDCMPELRHGRAWTTFIRDTKGRTVLPGEDLRLLELSEFEGEKNFAAHRDTIRKALAALQLRVEYSDIYKTCFPRYRRDLKWFGRHDT